MSVMSQAYVHLQVTTDRLSEFFTPIADTITSTVMGGVNAVSSSPTVQVPSQLPSDLQNGQSSPASTVQAVGAATVDLAKQTQSGFQVAGSSQLKTAKHQPP